ncbi:MAG TPA: dihydrofolate reductase family protein [Xanthobacteraceae bacterium]|jgi:dihydrofolate reductase
MSKVVVEMSLSLDGFVVGPDDRPGQPFGTRKAERLHAWLLSGSEPYEGTFLRPEGRNRELVDAFFHTTGALLTGRRTYDLAHGWGGSHPIPGLPVVVLTHKPPADVPKGKSSFTFCTTGVEDAVEAANRLAKEKDVMVHGADTTRQLLAAGLVDELRLHVVPILLGDGRRMFERNADDLPLEMIETVATPQAVHLRYRVCR